MKCTAVRKRDEREGNEYKREAAARKSGTARWYGCYAHQKLSNSPVVGDAYKSTMLIVTR